MKHLSWRYRRKRTAKEQKEFREAQRKRIEKRWEKELAGRVGEPVRQTRVVELEIRDSMRPRTTIRLEAEEAERGWGRWAVWQDGVRVGTEGSGKGKAGRGEPRRFGTRRIAGLIGCLLR